MVSDGVHDNLDPSFLGYTPADLGLGHLPDANTLKVYWDSGMQITLAHNFFTQGWDTITDKKLLLKAKTSFIHQMLKLHVLNDEKKVRNLG